ncbi:TadE family type IV pilus minor pilin [Streptosporangium sp. NPDC000396]|uniref:TadE family type IV pilus minor pilin n=1 Tax=Streptosporangium sp. NPDC000396 TaxID=3366185 RepID=UPI00367818F8
MTFKLAVARLRRSKGSVTAETAVVLPAVVVMLAAALWALTAVEAQLECVDAARAGARAASRGESLERVRSGVLAASPAGALVVVTRNAEITRVEVSVSVKPRWGASLPSVPIRAVALSATEPGVE